MIISIPDGHELKHAGLHYQGFLRALSAIVQPNSYMEIGTNTGESVEQFDCDVICIDPKFVIANAPFKQRRRSLFFQMSSDDFFATENVLSFFPRGVDLAFLDGMHRFEYLLRDFINTERACHATSLIVIHDCLPINARMAERTPRVDPSETALTSDWWTGDVWRILPIFQKYRPDLKVKALDCPPTGLIAVSGLDPNNRSLSNHYHDILEEFASLDLNNFGLHQLWSLFPMFDSRNISKPEVVTAYFTVR